MKHEKKSIVLSFIAIALAVAIAFPQQSFAASDAKKPTATKIQYVTENGKKTGIRTFTIDPFTYYNLSQDPVINKDNARTLKLNDAKLLQIAKRQIFPKWGVIAEGVFRDQADQLVTIEGSGMMSSSTTSSNSFDRHFSTSKVNNGYTDDWAVSDLAQALSQETSSHNGKRCWDETRITGVTHINNLNEARTLMGQELRNCSDDNDVSKDDFLGNGHQKSEDKRRLPDLEDDKTGEGFANIVTCVNRAGASGDYDYVSFGIAVYDFDITPVAAEDLKYIEAADDEFTDDSGTVKGEDILKGLAGNHISKTGISFHNDDTDGTTSYLRNNTNQEVTQSSGLENSVTEENTISTDDTFEWGMEQTVGSEWNLGGHGDGNCMFPRVTLNFSNSWHELWSTTKGKSDTKSTSKTRNINTEVTLPGHTVAVVRQSLNNKRTTEQYQQPVILSYKVAIFAMSGDYFNGSEGGIENNRYDKQWMSVIFDGSDDSETSGCNALGSLYNRAVTNRDTQGYDGSKGRYRSWCDKSAWNKSNKINWSNVSATFSGDNRSSHRIQLGTGRAAINIQDLATELPLIEKAQTLSSRRESITSSVEEIIPMYSLGSVEIKSGAKEYDLMPRDTLYLDSIDLEGYDNKGAEFYDFNKAWGEWVLLDKDEKIIEDGSDDDAADETGIVRSGPIELKTENGSQKVTVSAEDEGFNTTQKLEWRLIPNEVRDGKEIADDSTSIVSNEELNRAADSDDPPFMTNEEKLNADRPTITLVARDTANDIENFETEGSYKGPMNEPVNLSHVFTADAVDASGKIRSVPVFWESKGTAGITVDRSGETTFTRKGTYKVRPFSYDMSGTKIVQKDKSGDPVWLEVTAQDKAVLSSIVINKPELEADDTTLTEGTTALGFDLASYTKYFDQYGDKWEGSKADPLPEVRYSVSPGNGAYIDGEDILTVTSPGTYTISANAYDPDGSDTGFKISPVRITVTEEDRLASITMDEPALNRDERTLKGKDGCVTVPNLKGLLTYINQHDEEWTGKKPNVTFSVAGDPESAEIKGGNFYAYAPGTYTIRASASGYSINSISIEVLEDQSLVLKTENPGRQYLYTGDDEVELELERYINATTGYGSKWKGEVPEMKFTLYGTGAAEIETKTVYDGDDDYAGSDRHYFRTSIPGEYTVHVEPLKASEYSGPIDDMTIRVVRGKKVARIEFANIGEEADPKDLSINNYTSEYPSIDLSRYLTYYDGYGELIDPAKDHVKIPDIKYTVTYPEDSEDSYDLNGEIFTAYEAKYFFVKAEINMTNNDPHGADGGKDTILEANTGFGIEDYDWQHDFSGGWETTKEPTCTEDGVRVRRCSGGEGCINHKDGESGSCTEEVVDTIPATGHTWSKYYSFDESDKSLYTVCEICGAINEESRTLCNGTPDNGWDSSGRPVPSETASCTSAGKYRVSDRYGDYKIVEVPAVGHSWSREIVVKEPTCKETGQELIKSTCERCGETQEEFFRNIPKVPHEAEDPDTDNWAYYVDENGQELKESCEDYGLKSAECKYDGCDEKLFELISPTGHDWGKGEVVTKATSTKSGLLKYTCTHGCGATKTEVIPATGGQEAVDAAAAAGTAISRASKINSGEYTAASYKAVKDATAALNKVLADPNASADQIKAATQSLEKAIKALEKKQKTTAKKKQKISVKKKTVKVKAKTIKKKAKKVKALTVKNGKGKITYKGKGINKKSKKALKINAKTGKITIKKKTKKGTYKMKVKVTASGNLAYAAASRTVTVTIKVK